MSIGFNEPRPYVLIAPEEAKEEYYALRRERPDLNISFYTKEDLISLFGRKSDPRAVKALLKEGISYEKAKDLLEAFKAPYFERTRSEKLLPYKELREKLIVSGLLMRTPFPGKSFEGKHVLIKGYRDTALIGELISNSSHKMAMMDFALTSQKEEAIPSFERYKTLYEELHVLFNRVAHEIDMGTKPEDIYLFGLSDPTFFSLLKDLSSLYGFSLDIGRRTPLLYHPCFSNFLKAYEETGSLEKALDAHLALYPKIDLSLFLQEAYVLLEGVSSPEEGVALLREIARSGELSDQVPLGAVHIANGYYLPEGKVAFAANFSMGSYPLIYKDNGFLLDEEKEEIGLYSARARTLDEDYRLSLLLHSPNLRSLSYSETALGEGKTLSGLSLVYRLKEVGPALLPYEYSKARGEYLLSSLLDKKKAFDMDDRRIAPLEEASGLSSLTYPSFDPSFKGGLPEFGKKEGKPYTLSATSLQRLAACPFSYFAKYLSKLETIETTFQMRLGDVFHKVQEEHARRPEVTHEELYEEAIRLEEKARGPWSPKETFFLEHLRPYSKKGLKMMDEVESPLLKLSPLSLPEGAFSLPYNKELLLDGRYDRIDCFVYNEERYLSVIDFKTGNPDNAFIPAAFELNGITPQLPLYAYCLLHSEDFKDAKIAGLWIAPLLSMDFRIQNGDELTEKDKKSLRLSGIGLKNPELFIRIGDLQGKGASSGRSVLYRGIGLKSEKGKKKGEEEEPWRADSLPHVYSDEDFQKRLVAPLENLFRKALTIFHGGDFKIDPARFDKIDACRNCSMRDLCYRKEKDFPLKKLPKDPGSEDQSEEESEDIFLKEGKYGLDE